mgnify:CR=1 FL=1
MSGEEKTRITVEIYGMPYKLAGHSSSGHMQRVARQVDEQMRSIAREFPKLDTQRVAVLAAINLADEYLKLADEMERERISLQNSMAEAREALAEEHRKLREAYEEVCRKLDEAGAREADLRERLGKLQEEYDKLRSEFNEWIQLNLESER